LLEHLTQLASFAFVLPSVFHHGFTLSIFFYAFSAPKVSMTPAFYLFV
uniref:Uncharacterized protein n=1 Tax=Equus asinus asinus TaxID=83772 RepID=A0A8C4KQY9_EQUAS